MKVSGCREDIVGDRQAAKRRPYSIPAAALLPYSLLPPPCSLTPQNLDFFSTSFPTV